MIRVLIIEEGVRASMAGMTPLLSTTLLTGPLPQEVSQVSVSSPVIDNLGEVYSPPQYKYTTRTCIDMCE